MNQKWLMSLVLIPLLTAVLLAVRRQYVKPPTIRDLSGGAVIQRKRIGKFIDSTSQLNIESAIESLNDNGESFFLVTLAGLSSSNPDVCFIKQVLADRRVSKIFQHLVDQPPDLASSLASDIFDKKLSSMVETWKRMAFGEDSLGKLGPDHHAASVGLFLCSYFCPPHVLDEKLQDWNQQMIETDIFDKIEGVEYMGNNREVNTLFRLNLLVISGSRNGASVERLNRELGVLSEKITGDQESFIQVETVNLFKWNAETLDTDFTHVTRGVPASGSSILVKLPGFPEAKPTFIFLLDAQVLAAVENTIEAWRNGGN